MLHNSGVENSVGTAWMDADIEALLGGDLQREKMIVTTDYSPHACEEVMSIFRGERAPSGEITIKRCNSSDWDFSHRMDALTGGSRGR